MACRNGLGQVHATDASRDAERKDNVCEVNACPRMSKRLTQHIELSLGLVEALSGAFRSRMQLTFTEY